ncbi:uncharacterized protein FFNC_10024 [Fusarium fujikuroi]|nr:uncharacterized protein FFE2_08897 [Fusarium fujikuroi]SCO07014.1 uncharacterized protein FFC1_10286 [Fusarium fujikuroi]SCO44759.1 uncharacterized protein FFNC_10024 [Fusarium fujikuroi]
MSLVITKIAAGPPKKEEQLREEQLNPFSIHYTLEFETSHNTIPERLLRRRPFDEKRFHGRVPGHLLEPGRFWRWLVNQIPSVHIVEAESSEYCNVSATDSCLDFLLDLDFPIKFEGWAIFHNHLKAASADIRHQFFQLCASLAPSLDGRTDESWNEHFQTICTADKPCKAKHPRRLGLLHMLFQSVGGKGMRAVTLSFDDYATKSVNDNLADLRRLFGDSGTDQKAFNELNVGDQVTRYVPIGFPEAVYKTLPASLINALPFNAVKGAQCMIADTYREMHWIKKAENNLFLLLCYCSISPKVDNHLREWVNSSEGQNEYYQMAHSLKHELCPEELALALTVLCFFERLLGEADEDTGHKQESCITGLPSRMSNLCLTEEPRFRYSCLDEFLKHINGNESRIRPNLWRIVGASFRKACIPKNSGGEWRCNLKVLHWLAASIHDEQRTDDQVEAYWDDRLAESETVAIGDKDNAAPV